ncbi:uncharacterized protein L203_106080 [Cryptococcus depauperatus CBS 7841]|uniref:Uncharacterized protein n=1 Tax=Cryptococcus depauperatus CBS 7841 TaxID=1295531 RepID=A0A1E3IV76_9TREE|nr:hypothetical protein L203_00787 [Cryptococcus depauperatus CBS 7841]
MPPPRSPKGASSSNRNTARRGSLNRNTARRSSSNRNTAEGNISDAETLRDSTLDEDAARSDSNKKGESKFTEEGLDDDEYVGLDRKAFFALAESKQSENQQDSFWTRCCGPCAPCWKTTWGWSGWTWLARNSLFILTILMLAFAAVCTCTGPQLGIWMVEAGGYKLGGLGWCDSEEVNCQSKVLYSSISVDSWPSIIISTLLLGFGFLGVLHILLILHAFFFVYHRFQSCGEDPETQHHEDVRKLFRRRRQKRWLDTFERITIWISFGYCAIAVVLIALVVVTHAKGLIGFRIATFLLVSPFSCIFFSSIYRGRWAYGVAPVEVPCKLNNGKTYKKCVLQDKWGHRYEEHSWREVVATMSLEKSKTKGEGAEYALVKRPKVGNIDP